MSTSEPREQAVEEAETTVTVKCTGHVRMAVGEPTVEWTFPGTTLREFLADFFATYDVEELVMATEDDAESARGWAQAPEQLPGTWRANPAGDRTRRYARVTVNGTFNELLDGLDTELAAGDRVALIYPFMYCC
jgi:molybdopterin converting factor small subunit